MHSQRYGFSAFFSRFTHCSVIKVLLLISLCMSAVFACDSLESVAVSIPEVPQLSVDQVHRGAFLGVWGLEAEQGSEKVWFVGGEVLNANESHSMIASYTKGLRSK